MISMDKETERPLRTKPCEGVSFHFPSDTPGYPGPMSIFYVELEIIAEEVLVA